jgi:hypothetical protein
MTSNTATTTPAAPATVGQRRYEVTFNAITVSALDDPGSNAEVDIAFRVNAITRHFVDNDLGLGTTTLPDKLVFTTDVPTDGTITIDISGIENDVTSADDPLPTIRRTFRAADQFGVGSHRVNASNRHLTYSIDFEIADQGPTPEPPPPPDGGGGGKPNPGVE